MLQRLTSQKWYTPPDRTWSTPSDRGWYTPSYKEGIPILDRIRMAGKMRGVKGIEIHYPYEVDESSFDAVRRCARDEGLKILTVIPGLFNEREFKDGALISYDRRIRQKAIERIKTSMLMNEELERLSRTSPG